MCDLTHPLPISFSFLDIISRALNHLSQQGTYNWVKKGLSTLMLLYICILAHNMFEHRFNPQAIHYTYLLPLLVGYSSSLGEVWQYQVY